jgi:hypothetical protein
MGCNVIRLAFKDGFEQLHPARFLPPGDHRLDTLLDQTHGPVKVTLFGKLLGQCQKVFKAGFVHFEQLEQGFFSLVQQLGLKVDASAEDEQVSVIRALPRYIIEQGNRPAGVALLDVNRGQGVEGRGARRIQFKDTLKNLLGFEPGWTCE